MAFTYIEVGVEIPHVGTANTAAVAQLHAVVLVDFVGEVQGGVEFPVAFVYGFHRWVVEVYTVEV